jgi:two-component system CheB/CheR fusion protein
VTQPTQSISVYGDRLRLVQIFVNLLNNAIKYTPAGGHIHIEACADERTVTVAVTDTGVGIAASELPHIFNLFEQAGQSASGTEGGLGIGLAITKRLVELHGGKIHVRSHPGLGSTFKVCLPRLDRRLQPSTKQPLVAHAAARVLLVEDNADVAETMAMLLRASGHEVHIAPNGARALALAEERAADIYLVDLGLPDIHGYELVRQLRAKDRARTAYMIAVSGHARPSDVRRSLEAGFDKHLAKPVDLEALNALLAVDRRASGPG